MIIEYVVNGLIACKKAEPLPEKCKTHIVIIILVFLVIVLIIAFLIRVIHVFLVVNSLDMTTQ